MKLIVGFIAVTRWIALASVTVYSASSYAETALEREVLNAPSPHTMVRQGKSVVTVHFASLRGYLVGSPNNEIRLKAVREQVDQCVAEKQSNGYPVKPPTEWPDHLNGMREDQYVTDRMAITYFQGWVYVAVSPIDCSLFVSTSRRESAVLRSSAGLCQIDITKKTARGQCNIDAHRAAKTRNPTLSQSSAATLDAKEQIANLSCQVQASVTGIACIATDGQMVAAYPLVLQRDSLQGMQLKATQAALDIRVDESIFAPHMNGGFTIQNTN